MSPPGQGANVTAESREHPGATCSKISDMNIKNFTVSAIDPKRLEHIRAHDADERGEPLKHFPAEGWEPLRCCLRFPNAGEQIALLSFSPFPYLGPWAESGPIYIHSERCCGYTQPDKLPSDFRTGPRILRTYRADGTLDYENITLVPEGEDLEKPIRQLLEKPAVSTIHVRAVLSQCYTYRIDA
jgi:hypothetical protein